MQSLLEYLASAPKSHLAKLYQRNHPEAGLLQSSRIVETLKTQALDRDRVGSILKNLDKEGRRLLLAVYVAEERGMLESELIRGSESGPAQALFLLATLEYEMLIFYREGEGRSYHGFLELSPLLLTTLFSEFISAEALSKAGWSSNAAHLGSHLCHFLGKAARGEVRITQAGELHRKSLQDLCRGFSTGSALSSVVAEEEANFLFHFSADAGLLVEDEGLLRPSSQAAIWLEEGRAELTGRLREWWLLKRVGGLTRTLKELSEKAGTDSAYSINSLIPLFSVYSGWEKPQGKTTGSNTWENLPRALRELWILGSADFHMLKGRIHSVRIRWDGMERSTMENNSAMESPIGLPNFEALVPVSAPLHRQFQVETLARRENDEFLTRYLFSKESVVGGLQAGMNSQSLQELAGWLGFEVPARRALADWAASYLAAVFRELFVLQVRDHQRFQELEDFTQFMEMVVEVIPGYGFVVAKSSQEKVRELLLVFNLAPGEESSLEKTMHPVVPTTSDLNWNLATFSHGEIVYRHIPPIKRELPNPNVRERGNRGWADSPLPEKLQIMDDAIRLEKKVEFAYNSTTGPRIKVQPLHILRNRTPLKMIAVDLASGHRNEYIMDQVLGLRTLESE